MPNTLRGTRCYLQQIKLLMIVSLLLASSACLAALASEITPSTESDFTPPIRTIVSPDPAKLGPEVQALDQSLPMSPPPDPQVGDSWLWWLHIHYPMPPHFEQVMCTVRGKSDRAYVIVRDEDWGVNMDQTDVDAILDYWENISVGSNPDQGIYELDTEHFGAAPDELDDDERIYLLWFDFEISADGYFFAFDQEPDGHNPGLRSNECEVLYLNCNASQGPSSEYMLGVAAHEFEHMIHWKYDANEASWVDEGMAELAMWYFGHPDHISMFNNNPDRSLVTWDGDWTDYIKTYLWSLYFRERYGDNAVYDLVHEPANSIAGYENVLSVYGSGETVADLFADWAVANFLDDPSIGDGRFGYTGDDLPTFYPAGTYTTYPVLDQTRSVQYWATDYYRFNNFTNQNSVMLYFDGSDSNQFAVSALALYADGTKEVKRMEIDSETQAGSEPVFGLNNPADEVILVVSSVTSSGSGYYVFSAEQPTAGVDDPPVRENELTAGISFTAAPNPFVNEVHLRIVEPDGQNASLSPWQSAIYDAGGRLVRNLQPREEAGNVIELIWDGRQENGQSAEPGIYYVRSSRADQTLTREIILVR